MRYLQWLAPLTAALAYATWSYFAQHVTLGDLPPFDLHLYSHPQALTYLAALSPEARATYLGPLHNADLALLISLTATLILPVWRKGWLWKLPALCYAGFDLAENAAVAALLTHGAREAGEVAVISILTTLKFSALACAGLLALAVIWRNRAAASR